MNTTHKQNSPLVSKNGVSKLLRVAYRNVDSVLAQLGLAPVVELPSGPRYSREQLIKQIDKRSIAKRPRGRTRAFRQPEMKNI